MDNNSHLANIVNSLVAEITAKVLPKVENAITEQIKNKLGSYDWPSVLREASASAWIDEISKFNFPENVIDPQAIKLNDLKISGNNVSGGIIENFSSTGIDDRASQVALTLLDDYTVIENKLLTKDLNVEGSVTINGEFIVNGTVPEDTEFFKTLVANSTNKTLSTINNSLFDNFVQILQDKIKEDGLDLNKLTLNGGEVVNGNSLGNGIINSNLQKLGQLKELTVSGESLFAQTLYVSSKRVGINTIEPSSALSIWDDEIEISFKKQSRDTAFIGCPRHQNLILGSNNKDNIILESDGSTKIDHLKIGSMQFTTAGSPPNYVSERCHVVWNTNPNPGGPLGWICLGGANWANFGIID